MILMWIVLQKKYRFHGLTGRKEWIGI